MRALSGFSFALVPCVSGFFAAFLLMRSTCLCFWLCTLQFPCWGNSCVSAAGPRSPRESSSLVSGVLCCTRCVALAAWLLGFALLVTPAGPDSAPWPRSSAPSVGFADAAVPTMLVPGHSSPLPSLDSALPVDLAVFGALALGSGFLSAVPPALWTPSSPVVSDQHCPLALSKAGPSTF